MSYARNLFPAQRFEYSVLEMNTRELFDRIGDVDDLSASHFYARVLFAHLTGDLKTLNHLSQTITFEGLRYFVEFRNALATRTLNSSDITSLAAIEFNDLAWSGEKYFLLGLANHLVGSADQAFKAYSRAARDLAAAGLNRKAVKARFNAIVAESRVDPEKRLTSVYLMLREQALKVGDSGTAGLCSLNISREYQKLGALSSALVLANDAIENLNCDQGILHRDYSVAHRCHLYIELGRIPEARLDFEQLGLSPYPEIRESLKVIELALSNAAPIPEQLAHLSPVWKERLAECLAPLAKSEPLTPLEEKLLTLLGTGPKSKEEIIDGIYGEQSARAYSHLEDRFKNLLMRLRKKRPSAVEFSDSRYSLKGSGWNKIFGSMVIAFALFANGSADAAAAKVQMSHRDPETGGVTQTISGDLKSGDTIGFGPSFAQRSANGENGRRPWLLKISSEYADEVTGARRRFEGSGFLVRGPGDRMFVVTAAHVSQGERISVEYLGMSSQKLQIVGRRSFNLDDLEILEVEKFSDNRAGVAQKVFPLARFESGRLVVDDDARSVLGDFRKIIASTASGQFQQIGAADSVPLPTWTQVRSENRAPEIATAEIQNSDTEILALGQVSPGTSGAPLLSYSRGLEIAGVTSRVNRFFLESYFTPREKVESLLRDYLERVASRETFKWSLREGNTYRVSLDGRIAEVSYERASVSISVPVGNGTEANGGNGTEANGGNGTEANGGSSGQKLSSSIPLTGRIDRIALMAYLHTSSSSTYPVLANLRDFATGLKGREWIDSNVTLSELWCVRWKSDCKSAQNLKNAQESIRVILGAAEAQISISRDQETKYIDLDITSSHSKFEWIRKISFSSGRTLVIDLRGLVFVNPVTDAAPAPRPYLRIVERAGKQQPARDVILELSI